MKAFWIYTALRVLLFVVTCGLLLLARAALSPLLDVPVLAVLMLALLISSVASWVLLREQRDRLALAVQHGAGKASARLEASRSKEDVD